MNYKRLSPHIIHLDTVDSTNNYAANLLKTTKVVNGTVVMTKRQTDGRGQRGSSWQTEDDKNLTFSVLLFPDILATEAFYLTIAVSLALQRTIAAHLNQVKIKWPNDILVNKKKIAGVLIENQLRGTKISSSIVGIGININQEKFDHLITACSFKSELNHEVALSQIFDQFYANLDFYLNLLMEKNFKLLLSRYYEHLYAFKIQQQFEDEAGNFIGKITGVDQNGKLIIQKENGLRHYDLKELKLIL